MQYKSCGNIKQPLNLADSVCQIFADARAGEGNHRGITAQDARNGDVFLYLNTFILYTISSPTRSKNGEKRMFILRFRVMLPTY